MAVSSEHPYSDAFTNYLAVTLHMLSKTNAPHSSNNLDRTKVLFYSC